jgi:hypothetical protein
MFGCITVSLSALFLTVMCVACEAPMTAAQATQEISKGDAVDVPMPKLAMHSEAGSEWAEASTTNPDAGMGDPFKEASALSEAGGGEASSDVAPEAEAATNSCLELCQTQYNTCSNPVNPDSCFAGDASPAMCERTCNQSLSTCVAECSQ